MDIHNTDVTCQNRKWPDMSRPVFTCIISFVSLNRGYAENHSMQKYKLLSFKLQYLLWRDNSYIARESTIYEGYKNSFHQPSKWSE